MSPARRAAVVTPFFVDRDAVCNDAFHSARTFREQGWDARIYAVSGHSEREATHPIGEIDRFIRAPEDLVYFHFSTGRRDVLEAVSALKCRKWLKFHNITPPELFSLWSDELAEANRLGRREMAAIGQLGWERVWGDSSFNLAEIAPFLQPGTKTGVLAPFHETESLLALRPLAAVPTTPPRILTVGRIVQSKGQAFLIRVLRYLVKELGVDATLDIVGKPDHRLMAYHRLLEWMVQEYGLEENVVFHGEVSPEALARQYAEASVFLSGSEHEGFCVPIIEAMAFGVPVVALGTTAVPETVGEAGIVWEERDPRRFAVTLQRLLSSPNEREWLGQLGRQRFEGRFTAAALTREFSQALA